MRFSLPLTLAAFSFALAACGGTTDDPTSSGAPAGSATGQPPSVVTQGSAVEYFHRGDANMGLDHQRRVFSIVAHSPGSDASARVCGSLQANGDALAPGATFTLPSGLLYPAALGGGLAVRELAVASSATDALVLHVTLKNGESFDDRWSRGLGTGCAGDCTPPVTTCH